MIRYSSHPDIEDKLFITDCEGPISRNDNAMELSEFYIPEGDRFFSLLSKYDDVLAYIIKKENYNPGNTLKLIFPFLIAFGATFEGIKEYSKKNILLLPSVKETLKNISKIMPVFIISTSYEPYIEALCDVLDFPVENAFCTKLNKQIFNMGDHEKEFLKGIAEDIKKIERFEIPADINSIDKIPSHVKEIIDRLNNIFWNEMYKLNAGWIMDSVNPAGGKEKTKIIIDIISKKYTDPSQVIYVGDSITDMDALKYVKENKGLSISFNGNRYALMEAEIGVLSSDAKILHLIAETFINGGRKAVIDLASRWNQQEPRVFLITPERLNYWITESELYRRKVRGEKIGSLG